MGPIRAGRRGGSAGNGQRSSGRARRMFRSNLEWGRSALGAPEKNIGFPWNENRRTTYSKCSGMFQLSPRVIPKS